MLDVHAHHAEAFARAWSGHTFPIFLKLLAFRILDTCMHSRVAANVSKLYKIIISHYLMKLL
jgi:hypothetical protein